MAAADPIVLLTRPREASERLARDLADAASGAYDLHIAPVLEIEPSDPVPPLTGLGALVLTSGNAVARLGDVPAGLTAYCVGDRTAEMAAARGLRAISAGGDADALVSLILRDRPGGRLLHLCGETTRGQVAQRLTQAGLDAESVVVYRQARRGLDAETVRHLGAATRIIAPVFSPASASALMAAWPEAAPPPDLVAISAAAAGAWTGPVASCTLAHTPDGPSMIAALVQAIGADGPCS